MISPLDLDAFVVFDVYERLGLGYSPPLDFVICQEIHVNCFPNFLIYI